MSQKKITSTEQIRVSKFRQHGKVKYIIHGRMLETVAIGPFNEELVAALNELALIIHPEMMKQGPWVQYVIFRESALAPREGLAALTKLLKGVVENKIAPMATALVLLPEVEGATLMSPLYAKCYQESGIKYELFEDLNDAVKWLQSFLD